MHELALEHHGVSDLTQTERFLRARLRLLRKSAGLTQESLSELAGISCIFYQSIEAGRRPNVSLRTIDKISRAYGLTIGELFSSQMPVVKIERIPQPPHRQKRGKKGE
jgi:transcriptional regulator with XRE-family HTH domain